MLVLGIDEVGRGPAIGPMIVAGVLYDITIEKRLVEMGVRDSKKLSRTKRELLEKEIKKIVQGYWIDTISVQTMDRRNLNSLEIESFISIINKSSADSVFLDALVQKTKIDKLTKKIKDSVGKRLSITALNHADEIYPCVSAASILAKVERDRIISNLRTIYGDFGSGYPGDEKTERFIREWHKFPQIVRKRWRPVREAMVKQGRIMIVGTRDTGKTALAKDILNIAVDRNMLVGVLDLDIGQAHIGQLGTLGFGISDKRIRKLESISSLIEYPVFSLSPIGSDERIFKGIKWIMKNLPFLDLLVVDTSGDMRDRQFLKGILDIIKPDSVISLEKEGDENFQDVVSNFQLRIYPIPVYKK